jgi:hypothetical protein
MTTLQTGGHSRDPDMTGQHCIGSAQGTDMLSAAAVLANEEPRYDCRAADPAAHLLVSLDRRHLDLFRYRGASRYLWESSFYLRTQAVDKEFQTGSFTNRKNRCPLLLNLLPE